MPHLVALRKSPEAAEADRQKVIKKHRRTQARKTIDWRTIEAAGCFMVLTTLDPSQVAPEEVLEMYRFRWQIELEAKRLKSLHHRKDLPAKTSPMIQTWMMAQMYMALLTQEVADAPSAFPPGDIPSTHVKVSRWRVIGLVVELVRKALKGAISLSDWLQETETFIAYLCPEKRRRRHDDTERPGRLEALMPVT